jgi:hypothetical protein
VLVILIQRRMPRDLLWPHVDRDRADQVGDPGQQVASDLADCPVRTQWDPPDPPVAVFDDRLMPVQIQGDNQ